MTVTFEQRNRLRHLSELLGQARRAWVRVDTLDVEWHTAQRAVDALAHEAVTGLGGPAGVGMAEIQGASARRAELERKRAAACAEALRVTRQAALEGWGVRIGGHYRVVDITLRRTTELVVEHMRPGASLACEPTLVLTGKDPQGTDQVVVLGPQNVFLEDVAPGVVALGAWREHRTRASS